MSLPDEDNEENENEQWFPFPSIALLTDDDDEKDDAKQDFQRPQLVRRDWGIPTFQDQMDRGIRTFKLQCLDDDEDDKDAQASMVVASATSDLSKPTVIIHLEHRLHSTGSDLWDSALVLAHALPRLLPLILEHTEWMKWRHNYQGYHDNHYGVSSRLRQQANRLAVLELGSGTGAVGLYCSKCLGMRQVILSDLQDNLSLTRKNCLANQVCLATAADTIEEDCSEARCDSDCVEHSNSVTICALDWTDPELPHPVVIAIQEQRLDLIIGSDLFLPFASGLLVHLAERLAQMLALCHDVERNRHSCDKVAKEDVHPPTSSATITATSVPIAILAYEKRFDCSDFFVHAQSLHLVVEEIDSCWLHPHFQDSERIHVLRITYLPPLSP